MRWALFAALQVLNALDTVATLFAVAAWGPGVELNPLMRALIATSPLAFVTVKWGAVWLGAELLVWRRCTRALAFVAGLYLGTAVLHLLLWL